MDTRTRQIVLNEPDDESKRSAFNQAISRQTNRTQTDKADTVEKRGRKRRRKPKPLWG